MILAWMMLFFLFPLGVHRFRELKTWSVPAVGQLVQRWNETISVVDAALDAAVVVANGKLCFERRDAKHESKSKSRSMTADRAA